MGKKKKSKIKKILGGIAAAGLTALAASKFGKGVKGNVLKTAASEDAYDRTDIVDGITNYTNDPIVTKKRRVPPMLPSDGYTTRESPWGEGGAKKGGSAGRAKRSTITGVAVRGFGRALKR